PLSRAIVSYSGARSAAEIFGANLSSSINSASHAARWTALKHGASILRTLEVCESREASNSLSSCARFRCALYSQTFERNTMSTIGVAIIGCGGITLQNHLPGLALCPEAKVVALC